MSSIGRTTPPAARYAALLRVAKPTSVAGNHNGNDRSPIQYPTSWASSHSSDAATSRPSKPVTPAVRVSTCANGRLAPTAFTTPTVPRRPAEAMKSARSSTSIT